MKLPVHVSEAGGKYYLTVNIHNAESQQVWLGGGEDLRKFNNKIQISHQDYRLKTQECHTFQKAFLCKLCTDSWAHSSKTDNQDSWENKMLMESYYIRTF